MNAGNAGPFTLDGTRTFLVGDRDVAIIDPGPDVEEHVRALASAVEDADRVQIIVTHRHADHAAAARPLADMIGAAVFGPSEVVDIDSEIGDGDIIETDAGLLVAIHTPGHTREHLSVLWPLVSALFVGDLLLGHGNTTWVAEYPGCVADYLDALNRVRDLACDTLYPAHGPAITDPPSVIDLFEEHRRARIEQVRDVLEERPEATSEEVLMAVYGPDLPESVKGAARQSLGALVDYVKEIRS